MHICAIAARDQRAVRLMASYVDARVHLTDAAFNRERLARCEQTVKVLRGLLSTPHRAELNEAAIASRLGPRSHVTHRKARNLRSLREHDRLADPLAIHPLDFDRQVEPIVD